MVQGYVAHISPVLQALSWPCPTVGYANCLGEQTKQEIQQGIWPDWEDRFVTRMLCGSHHRWTGSLMKDIESGVAID